jgi:hypothetical protein
VMFFRQLLLDFRVTTCGVAVLLRLVRHKLLVRGVGSLENGCTPDNWCCVFIRRCLA